MNGAVDTAPAVQLVGIERRYGEIVAVRGIDLAIADGEFFSLLGPSGCGKTTTLRMISGLEEPTVGRVEVRGRDMTRVPPHRRPVTTVFQNYALFPHLNVFENVAFGLRERRVGRAEVRSRVARLLELVDLSGRDTARPRELSGGQQQRVALARSLVLNPEVLLLDEPLGALDLKLRKQLQDLLKAVQREVGITFVYVTHDQEEAFSMSDRVAVMNLGRVEQIGGPREVYARPSTLFVAQFVGASNHFPARVVEVLEDGRYRADVGPLGTWSVAGVAGLAVGDAAVAIVRPEQVRADTDRSGERPGEIAISGRVTDVSFVGPAAHLAVESAIGTLRCVAPGHADSAEMASRFRWDATDVWLVAP
ncbi:MAG: spermidine/putrescine transport system ATP-binding protein, partial [Gaiellales bacterium]|nr:spermidine/putrescine transport system ATP-binding protein [Gaiellales bacterium]